MTDPASPMTPPDSGGRRPDDRTAEIPAAPERVRLLPPDHWRLAMARSILSGALCCLGDFAAGEPVMLAAYEALARNPDATPTRLGELIGRIIRCYESAGRAEEAAAWQARRDEITAEVKPKPGP